MPRKRKSQKQNGTSVSISLDSEEELHANDESSNRSDPEASECIYTVFGVDKKATLEDIKQRYRKLALQCHVSA
ncbi:hypothetical protein HMI55_003729 [Coelomomyces lativittatus]|nr:hypothetical protein HMI55_003729 [Coelomomyces lativittatus]